MEKRYCHNCGAELKEGANYCDKCGAKVVVETRPDTINATGNASKNGVNPDKKTAAWWLSLIGFITSIVSLLGYIPVPGFRIFYATNSLWLCVPSLVLCIISLVLGKDKEHDLKNLAIAGLIIDVASILITITLVVVFMIYGIAGYSSFFYSSSAFRF